MGGSNCQRRLMCPGSYHAEKAIPPSPPGYAAAEGTVCHTIMEEILVKGGEPDDYLDSTHEVDGHAVEVNGIVLQEKIDPALQAWDELVGSFVPEGEVLVEPTVGFQEGVWGSTDAVWRDQETYLNVLDWKFGRHYVSETNSYQLLFYAAATIYGKTENPKLLALRKNVKSARGIIVQPLTRPVYRLAELDLDTLGNFAEQIKRSIPGILDEKAPRKAGSWCKWCRARSVCNEYINSFKEEIVTPDWEKVDGVQLSSRKHIRDMAEAYVKEYDRMEREMLENGVPVAGRKLVRANGRWKWKDEAEQILRELGCRVKDIYEDPKLRSYSAMQAKFRGRKEVLDILSDIAVKTEGGLTVVDDKDKRPAEKPNSAQRKDAASAAKLIADMLG